MTISSSSSKTATSLTLSDEDGIVEGIETYDSILMDNAYEINDYGFIQVVRF